jgi:cell division septum initiation protein DivIVA
LNEDQKNKNEGLKTQIDDCLDAVKSIKRAINNNQKEFDLLQIRTIIENNNLLISKFNKDESNQIDYILNKTNLNIKKINEILVKYDKEKIDVASLNNLKKNIDALSSQYRAIQWILYL